MKVVLLVDDIAEYLDTMEINLPDGCRAVRAASLDAARKLMAEDPADVAVVDVRLREGDVANREGLELLEWICTKHPRTKVIVISAYREFEFEAEALALGAECFLRKPIQPDAFRDAVAIVLKGAQGSK
jgi:DNA-binding NtrC family response regulator